MGKREIPQGLFAYSPAAFCEKCCHFWKKALHVFPGVPHVFRKERCLFVEKHCTFLKEDCPFLRETLSLFWESSSFSGGKSCAPFRKSTLFLCVSAAFPRTACVHALAGLASLPIGTCAFAHWGLRESSVCFACVPVCSRRDLPFVPRPLPAGPLSLGRNTRRFSAMPLPAVLSRESALPYYICRKIPLPLRRKGKIAAEVPPFPCRAGPEKV